MTDEQQRRVLQPVTPEVIAQVRELIAGARHGALATLAPESGHPNATRVGLATLEDGTPIIFVSALAAHTPALVADPRCALLVGDVGKGDPLAHPRATLYCRAEPVARDSAAHEAALGRYLRHHPKAKLYAQLPDFRFFRLAVERISFNGGFGRAYEIAGADLISG